ncbi:MAG: EamA family transporter [Candidatus Dormibacteraceae bacterium]
MLALILWIPLALILGANFHSLLLAFPFALASAIISEALYFYALTKGQLSITAVLLGTYAIYTVVFSFLINGERLTLIQLISVAVTILGTLIVYLPSKFTRSELKLMGAIAIPLVTAIFIGLSDTASKGFINYSGGDQSFLLMLTIVQIPVAIVYLHLEKQRVLPLFKEVRNQPKLYKQAIAGSLFNVIGTGLLWISFTMTLASIASPIAATSGAIVVLLAVFLLDEDLNWRTAVGLLATFVGIIGISLTSGRVL